LIDCDITGASARKYSTIVLIGKGIKDKTVQRSSGVRGILGKLGSLAGSPF
jgi:hypothetical protein